MPPPKYDFSPEWDDGKKLPSLADPAVTAAFMTALMTAVDAGTDGEFMEFALLVEMTEGEGKWVTGRFSSLETSKLRVEAAYRIGSEMHQLLSGSLGTLKPAGFMLGNDTYILMQPKDDPVIPGSLKDNPRSRDCFIVETYLVDGNRGELMQQPYTVEASLEEGKVIHLEAPVINRTRGPASGMARAFLLGITGEEFTQVVHNTDVIESWHYEEGVIKHEVHTGDAKLLKDQPEE